MNNMLWGYLIHLGFNFWQEAKDTPDSYGDMTDKSAQTVLKCDPEIWREVTDHLAEQGLNMLLIDLGEGVRYESHPELAVSGSWSTDELRQELARLRAKGITPIPKMNFSTSHDEWLGEYARMVSTPKYYEVCKDLIEEVIDIFDTPELFHLGMDEETYGHQKTYSHAIVRNGDLWWQDFYRNLEVLEKHNVRGWVWSDYAWQHPDIFLQKMPKDVMQSNWHYGSFHNLEDTMIRTFDLLDEHGYDQIPTGALWSCIDNMEFVTKYCKNAVSAAHLKGFLQTSWKAAEPKYKNLHKAALDLLGTAKKHF